MTKADEQAQPASCWNRAQHDERMFILLARDLATPATIRFWCAERLRIRLNEANDTQINEALAWRNASKTINTSGEPH